METKKNVKGVRENFLVASLHQLNQQMCEWRRRVAFLSETFPLTLLIILFSHTHDQKKTFFSVICELPQLLSIHCYGKVSKSV